MPKYKVISITSDKARQIIDAKKDQWEWICENHNGSCHWNNVTGELIWMADDGKSNYSKLNK